MNNNFFDGFCEEVQRLANEKDLDKAQPLLKKYCYHLTRILNNKAFDTDKYRKFLISLYNEDEKSSQHYIVCAIYYITIAYLLKKKDFNSVLAIIKPYKIGDTALPIIIFNILANWRYLSKGFPPSISNKELKEVDLILTLIHEDWPPRLYYKDKNSCLIGNSTILQQCESKRYAEKFMILFGCSSVEELKSQILQRCKKQTQNICFELDCIIEKIANTE
jgi:hypothetical protein